jgi:hypothetical protein
MFRRIAVTEDQQPKLEWVKPQVRQMGAGSAEQNTSGQNVDNILNPS